MEYWSVRILLYSADPMGFPYLGADSAGSVVTH